MPFFAVTQFYSPKHQKQIHLSWFLFHSSNRTPRYLEGLADNVTAFCKDPTQKEAFVETFGAKKRITFEVYDHTKGDPGYYNRTRNDNGTLMMGSNKECFISNTGEIGKDLSVTCSGDSVMNVATRKNIQDFEGKRDENLARINKAVGLEFSLDIDWVPFAKLLSATQAYKDRIGWMIYEAYLESLADNLETLCKDEMSKEAVQEACDKKTIRFALDENLERGYGDCTFVDGVLTLSFPPARFGSNVGIIGQDIASRL